MSWCPNRARAAAIIEGKATSLRTRSEQELAGYRSALDYLFTQDWRPLNVGLLLHLHRELFARTKLPGGRFKDSDNLVVDRSPDGKPGEAGRPRPVRGLGAAPGVPLNNRRGGRGTAHARRHVRWE